MNELYGFSNVSHDHFFFSFDLKKKNINVEKCENTVNTNHDAAERREGKEGRVLCVRTSLPLKLVRV